jgi:hypothetical protein
MAISDIEQSDARLRAQSLSAQVAKANAAANAALAPDPFTSVLEKLKKSEAKLDASGKEIAPDDSVAKSALADAQKIANQPDVTKKLVSTYSDPTTGDVVGVYSDGSTGVLSKGTKALDAANAATTAAAAKREAGQSAYDLLYSQFKTYGLESLVEPLKGLITTGASPAEFTIKLRETDAYKKRFGGNAARIQKGLRALDEASYIALEDQYQNVMRNYGLPASYWEKDALGTQKGFTELIANDVSATELENRVQKATDFIDKSPKEYIDAVKQFYPEISRGDLMAYVLDPKNGLNAIQAKIGAAQIGGEYLRAGLGTDAARAEELQLQGVTADKARLGAQAIQELAPRGTELSQIYGTGPYGQAEVEAEAYGLANATEAKKKREKLVGLETAAFSGKSGVGVLGRDTGGLY